MQQYFTKKKRLETLLFKIENREVDQKYKYRNVEYLTKYGFSQG